MDIPFERRKAPLSWHNYIEQALGETLTSQLNLPGVFICGGCVRSYYLGERPSDVDCFVSDNAVHTTVLDILGREGLRCTFETITDGWHTLTHETPSGIPLQVISVATPHITIDHLLQSFDYTICQVGFNYADDMFYLHRDFFEHLACRNLVYTGSQYPLSSLRRAFKFQRKGFFLCDEMLIRIAEDIAHRINFEDEVSIGQHIAGMDPNGERRVRPID